VDIRNRITYVYSLRVQNCHLTILKLSSSDIQVERRMFRRRHLDLKRPEVNQVAIFVATTTTTTTTRQQQKRNNDPPTLIINMKSLRWRRSRVF
jgi:hypothetical protein